MAISPGPAFTISSRLNINCESVGLRGPLEELRLERLDVAEWISGPGAQRGFPSTELLPAVAVVLAGRDQGGVPRARQHRGALREGRAQPELRDEAAQRGVAQDLREALDPPGVHALQRVSARQVRLPVLRRRRRPDLRPPGPALARRPDHLDQRGRGLLGLQPAQGQHDDGRGAHVPLADAVPADRAPPASQRPAVSAQLPARQLARLSLLGYRARSVGAVAITDLVCACPPSVGARSRARRIVRLPHNKFWLYAATFLAKGRRPWLCPKPHPD